MDYRQKIYTNYHNSHVNSLGRDAQALLEQQSSFYIQELVPLLPSDRSVRILELGCGFGSFIKAAKDAGYSNIKGIDLSEDQVATAEHLGINEVKLASIDDALSGGDQYDLIVGIDIIEHFSKNELMDLMGKILSSLKEGGQVLFRTPNMDAPYTSVFAHADFSHECLLNKSSAQQLMTAAGYSRVEVLPSLIWHTNPLKGILAKLIWSCKKWQMKAVLFASGRTWDKVVFSPNLIIKAHKA